MNRPFFQLIQIQFKEYWREPEVLFWTLAFPVIMAWVLGITFLNKPVMNYKAGWVVDSNDARNAPALNKPGSMYSKYVTNDNMRIQLKGRTFVENIHIIKMTREEAVEALKNGKIALFIEETPESGASPVVFRFDPANEEATKIYLWMEKKLFGKNSPAITEPLKGLGSRYIDYLIPGLIALGIMNSTIWGVGWTLIEFRIKKFMRRMLATPMKKVEFMASLSLTRLALGLIEAAILFTFVYFIFDVKMEGSLASMLFIFTAGHMAFNGLAILIASRTESSRAGNTMINIITLPFFLLSGVFFSYENFPDWMVSFVKYLPLAVLADALRNIFLTPAGFAQYLAPGAYLLGMGLVFYAIGIRIYKWY